MNTVLQAERAAEQAISDCKQAAVQIVQAAQERAARIATRTDERLALSHMRSKGKITRELKDRQRAEQVETLNHPPQPLDDTALTEMVRAVARELIGVAGQQG